MSGSHDPFFIAAGQSALQSLSATTRLDAAGPVGGVSSYDIKIISIAGWVVKTAISSAATWQNNPGSLTSRTYVIQVVNQKDNSLVGKGTFVKM